ncbi:threonine--tRNA ligase [Dongia rigui]|uniref:Threonine--tRNA ligase n=1 Tax=Dongia rigui TaxID=940149 RepID=A0ABU5DXD7_9PROT|nr:threonine--tRNA ligase [Dongia rigui]MDY0871982.1 threonine--tRNA ligase [Dongia rigui]
MLTITLPDGAKREFPGPVSGAELAASIGAGLAKAALAIKFDGKVRDLATVITSDAKVEIVTRTHPDALDLIRHDAAHVMAEAVQELFPGTQITFGPATETGYYYDFHRAEPFTPEDFAAIEQRMKDIVDRDEKITREVVSRDEAVKRFKALGETFKAEWVNEIPADEDISLYHQGKWFDLCTGPHLPSTGKLGKAFKLMKVAGAYWRGDANNPQLQRVYGTAWADEKQLKDYLTQLEEAEKRDHRRLGREMNLFHQQEEAVGSVFWHPKGWRLYRKLESYIRRRLEINGYQEVKTPQILDRSFWEKSGHWEKFREAMFVIPDDEHKDKQLALKPMNCPGHVQIFRQGLKSYRDLPIRLAEFGACHRNEPSGALHGIMRVRAFTQDDAHIFCTEDQIVDETKAFCDFLLSVYKDFGFDDVRVKFSDRPEKRAGADAIWDKAEDALKTATTAAGLEFTLNPGEGAFYGPKLEFVLRDTIGRDWQCGTLQADFVLPERLDAAYVGEDGQKHRPVMLHRAIFGSLERFVGILIEHHAGKFPLWLAPTQVVVCPIVSDSEPYAKEVVRQLTAAGLVVETDFRNEKINYKVREHSLAKTPVIIAVGKRDEEAGTVAIRRLGEEGQKTFPLAEAVAALKQEAKSPLDR